MEAILILFYGFPMAGTQYSKRDGKLLCTGKSEMIVGG
jgi:hypothetical protein